MFLLRGSALVPSKLELIRAVLARVLLEIFNVLVCDKSESVFYCRRGILIEKRLFLSDAFQVGHCLFEADAVVKRRVLEHKFINFPVLELSGSLLSKL